MHCRLVTLVALAWISACGHGEHDHDHARGAGHHAGHEHAGESDAGGGHSHDPQHGGVLVALGDEYAHIELRLELETGVVQVWLYDREVTPVRAAMAECQLAITDGTSVVLAARANALTGETVGDTSCFEGQADSLIGRRELDGSLTRIEVLGQTFTQVPVRWVAPD